ncbi:MAG: response regulator transcription factor [Pseudomonadota bacterium]
MKKRVGPRAQISRSSVLIVDDHPLFCDALASAIETVFPGCRIEKVESLGNALNVLDKGFVPDLVIFDLKLPDVAGISGFVQLRSRVTDAPILVISSLASLELVQSLLQEGAAGFLPKDTSADKLKDVLSRIADGESYVPKEYDVQDKRTGKKIGASALNPKLASLTPQQQKIVRLICAGKPNKQIAFELSLAEATVKAHITALLRRLDVRNRTQVAVLVEAASATPDDNPEASAFLNR